MDTSSAHRRSDIAISVDDIFELMEDGGTYRLITASVNATAKNRLQLLLALLKQKLDECKVKKGSRFLMEVRTPIENEVDVDEIAALKDAVEKQLAGEGVWGCKQVNNNFKFEIYLVL